MCESGTKLSFVDMEDEDSLMKYMKSHCPRKQPASCWIMPSRTPINKSYTSMMDQIYNMDVRPDDTWVITFPKCGTTWTQEMVWLLGNNCDIEKAKQVEIDLRFPFLELNGIGSPIRYGRSTFDMANEMISPRFIKSHLPIELLPFKLWTVKPKIVYTSRNPVSTALSFYHHFTLFNGYDGDLDHFLDFFLRDYIDYGPFWKHLISFWNKSKDGQVLFLTFEEMKDDLKSVIRKTADFLDVKITAVQEEALMKHLSFSSMKDNPKVNKSKEISKIKGTNAEDFSFIRKGEKDEWKTRVSQEYIDKFDEWTRKNKASTDFPYY